MATGGTRRVVLGIGNPDRGDDGAGRTVVRLLRRRLPPDVEVTEHGGEAAALLAALEGAAAAYLVDACATGAPAGTIYRFDVSAAPLPQPDFAASTHGYGLAEAIELGRALGQLPSCCVVYAIEGGSFTLGAPLSRRVGLAAATVARRLQTEISRTVVSETPS